MIKEVSVELKIIGEYKDICYTTHHRKEYEECYFQDIEMEGVSMQLKGATKEKLLKNLDSLIQYAKFEKRKRVLNDKYWKNNITSKEKEELFQLLLLL